MGNHDRCVGLERGVPRRIQSALDSAGPQAASIEWLWWLMLAVSSAVFLAVMGALAIAIFRRRPSDPQPPSNDDRPMRVVLGATITTALILLALLVSSVATGRALTRLARPDAITIELTGHQWWWEARYPAANPNEIVTTANELHIPVGKPVLIQGTSTDVIHSFWVPNLHGKKDLIPGHYTNTWLQADRPGVFRGQCAEFCGLQHAHMGLIVVAEEPKRFDAWLRQQREPAARISDPQAQRGQQVFMSSACVLCHTIRGTDAGGASGPELTHFASRRTIAAATLPNTRGHLGGWIDPQAIKPGNRMPLNPIAGPDLQALLTYLETLK